MGAAAGAALLFFVFDDGILGEGVAGIGRDATVSQAVPGGVVGAVAHGLGALDEEGLDLGRGGVGIVLSEQGDEAGDVGSRSAGTREVLEAVGDGADLGGSHEIGL